MSTLLGKFGIADDASIYLQPATASATAAQSIGPRRIVRIVSDQGVNFKLGSTNAVTAPTAATGNRIPPNFPYEFETNDAQTWIIFFNPSASTANICITFLTRN